MATPTSGDKKPLSSDWSGLSPHLIARFFEVRRVVASDKKTVRWERVPDSVEVHAPLSEANAEATINWQSPFENVGPDQKFSSLSAMLQTGGFSTLLQQLQAQFPGIGALDSASQQVATLEGKSNFTKLNSTQVFNGMPPIKLSVTAHFRAYKDARSEVRDPLNQLMAWALPKKIAPDGPAMATLRADPAFFQSEVPQILGMKFADMLFLPIVIESIPYQLSGPRDAQGVLTQAACAMQLATLTALDKSDWANANDPSFWANSVRYP